MQRSRLALPPLKYSRASTSVLDSCVSLLQPSPLKLSLSLPSSLPPTTTQAINTFKMCLYVPWKNPAKVLHATAGIQKTFVRGISAESRLRYFLVALPQTVLKLPG